MNGFTSIGFAIPNRYNILSNQGFNFRRRNILQKEIGTNMYGSRKIHFAGESTLLLLDDYGRGNHLGKIIHDEFGENLLENIL